MQVLTRLAALALAATSLFAQAPSVTAETARLVFVAAPTAKGTVAAQVGQAVKYLKKSGQIVKLRAFVTAGTSLESVTTAVTGMFPAKARPVLNLIQIARLPDPSAQVLLEAVAMSKKIENPNGLVLISGQQTQIPLDPAQTKMLIAPLAEKSVVNLKAAGAPLDAAPEDFVRITCFTTSLEDHAQVQSLVTGAFPKAAVSVMQIQRSPTSQMVECEGVARLHRKPADAVRLVNPTKAAFAQAVVVTAPKVIFTTTYAGTSGDDSAVRQAFNGMKNGLATAGSGVDRVFYLYAYPANATMLQKYRDVRFEFLERANPPASTNLVFEGAGATGAGLGIDAIALPGR